MKRTILGAFAVLSLSLGLVTAAAAAQETQFRVNIPFDFTVGDTHLPAGVYMASPYAASGAIILIRSLDGKSTVLANTVGVNAKGEVTPKMVFRRYGNRYFLSQLWMEGDTARQLRKSRLETDIAIRDAAAPEVTVTAQSH